MAEETVHDVKNVPQGATVRVGSRGGLYYTTQNNPVQQVKKPDKILKGVGYEIHFYREGARYRVRYKGPYAEKVLNELRNKD